MLNVVLIIFIHTFVKQITAKIFTMGDLNIQEIREQLPIGAVTEISKQSGIHWATVQRFLQGLKTKHDVKLIEVTAQVLKEYKDNKSQALKKLTAAVNA